MKTIQLPYLVIFCVIVLSITSCLSEDIDKVEVKNANGIVIEEYNIRRTDGVRTGIYNLFYDGGELYETGHYKDGNLEGVRKLYYISGKLKTEETYKSGIFEGVWKSYYENGSLKLEGNYSNNSMEGEWKGYYESGELKEVVTFANNLENGPFVEYYPNNNIKAKGYYFEGDQEHGELQLYNEEGVLVKKMSCEIGVCRTIWTVKDTSKIKS